MARLIGFAIALLLLCRATFADIDYARVDPVAEVRGIWIDAGAIPKTDRGIREMVRSYARAHFNVLFPETICRGYAIYPSSIIKRDPRFAGAVDPLPAMIDEAHRLRMEVHPWVWTFRVGYSADKGSILTAHPDWAERDKDGCDLSPNGGYWLSPAVPEARDYLASLYAELVSRYDVDGIHLDYIRYETDEKKPFGFSSASKALFQKQYGLDPCSIRPESSDRVYWNTFRERLVNTFVQRISLQTKSIRPRAMVSAAVGSYPPDARLQLLQNWPNWVANKWVDFVTPMAYSTDNNHFGRLIFRQKEAVGNRTILAEGVGLFVHSDPAQTTAQIGEARKRLALGQVIFAASYCTAPQLDALRCGPYATAASLPFRDCRSATCALAAKAKAGTGSEASAYYSSAAATLSEYADYRAQKVGYVVPSAPPVPAP